MLENSVFNTEALKYSVRRINQLGYFKPLDETRDIKLDKTPERREPRRRARCSSRSRTATRSTSAPASRSIEGFFGQLSFQTSNFLGRGETLTVSLQSGSRAQNYSLGFTEPFLFERNITGGVNLFRSEVRYVGQYTQRSSGTVLTMGLPFGRGFTRFYTNYSYERVAITEINPHFRDPTVLARNPYLRDSLLVNAAGRERWRADHQQDHANAGHNTVDHPIFPTTGSRLTASLALAGLGGNVNYYKPTIESVYFLKQRPRLTFGVRGQVEYIGQRREDPPSFRSTSGCFRAANSTCAGFDLRTVGPTDPYTGLVMGGNKSLLLNLEEAVTIAPQVRLIFFLRCRTGSQLRRAVRLQGDGGPTPPDSAASACRSRRADRGSRRPQLRSTGEVVYRECLQSLDRHGGAVLHAGPERPVPADFCSSIQVGRVFSVTN